MNDPNLVWETRFVYPDTKAENQLNALKEIDDIPDLENPDEQYNFNYTISGAEYIAPRKIFDDGEFTFFEFDKKNADIPAFFLVDSAGREALVNYRLTGDYIVIERVASQFTLRHGNDVVCVFNESRPLRRTVKAK